jgi:hypothetical protein
MEGDSSSGTSPQAASNYSKSMEDGDLKLAASKAGMQNRSGARVALCTHPTYTHTHAYISLKKMPYITL